jgi:hypothetical protein
MFFQRFPLELSQYFLHLAMEKNCVNCHWPSISQCPVTPIDKNVVSDVPLLDNSYLPGTCLSFWQWVHNPRHSLLDGVSALVRFHPWRCSTILTDLCHQAWASVLALYSQIHCHVIILHDALPWTEMGSLKNLVITFHRHVTLQVSSKFLGSLSLWHQLSGFFNNPDVTRGTHTQSLTLGSN